jgi:hypothetical protein
MIPLIYGVIKDYYLHYLMAASRKVSFKLTLPPTIHQPLFSFSLMHRNFPYLLRTITRAYLKAS